MMRTLTALIATVAIVSVAEARETGDIRGEVTDSSGLAVPGLSVVISGNNLAGEKRVTTDLDGVFRFDGLAPGAYDLSVFFKDATVARASVSIALDKSTYVPLTVDLDNISAEITVVDVLPVIDATKSSFSSTLSNEQLSNLPVGRSYQDVVNTLPGVSGRVDTSSGGNGDGNPSVRGEGQYGNNYFIDGVSTRDPATKTFGVNVPFDAIEQITVYTDGAPAEYGQFTGMMVNVVTKDGGDEHFGTAGFFYSQHAYFDKNYDIFSPDEVQEIPTQKARFRSPSLQATAGGPIIKEKLWYFAALNLGHNWSVPEGLTSDQAIKSTDGLFMGKLTWFATDALTLRYALNQNNTFQNKYDASQFILPEAQSNRRDYTTSHLATATYAPDEQSSFEFRLGLTELGINVVPASGDDTTASRLDGQGRLLDNAMQYDYNKRLRYGGGLTFTHLTDSIIGRHKIRTGFEFWTLRSQREIVNTGITQTTWVGQDGQQVEGDVRDVGTAYSADPTRGLNCEAADYSDCGYRTYNLNAGSLGNTVNTAFLFLQDDWQPTKRVTVNAGVRLDIEDGRSNDGNAPPTQDPQEFELDPSQRIQGTLAPVKMFSPRLGLAWDVTGDSKTKITANYGRYYDIGGAGIWEWANSRSAAGFVRYANDGQGNYDWTNTQDPEAYPLIYDAGLKPAHTDKFTLGGEREVAKDLSIGIRGILSRTSNVPEDVDVNLNDFYITNPSIKERFYRALEVTVEKKWADRWQLFGNYTLSESWGHTPGQFELAPGSGSGSDGNNVGVYLDDIGEESVRQSFYEGGYGWILEGFKGTGRYSVTDPDYNDDAGFYGYLPYHSFHQIKLNGSYTANWGTTFGLVYEFDSGHAWQKRTFVPFYGYDGFAQGRGTRFMPATHYVDVRAAHKFKFDEKQSLELALDIFNLPGFAQAITYFENDAPGFGSTLYRQSPRSARLSAMYRW